MAKKVADGAVANFLMFIDAAVNLNCGGENAQLSACRLCVSPSCRLLSPNLFLNITFRVLNDTLTQVG